MLASSSNDKAQVRTFPSEFAELMPCGAGFERPISASNRPSVPPGGLLMVAAFRATGMNSSLARRTTAGLEKTTSRAAPANTQQRSSSMGRSMKIHNRIGFRCSRDSFNPSIRQARHSTLRQATCSCLSASTLAVSSSGGRTPAFARVGWPRDAPMQPRKTEAAIGRAGWFPIDH